MAVRTVYITKYALTRGIIVCKLELNSQDKTCYGKPTDSYCKETFYHDRGEFELNKQDAEQNFNTKKADKINLLNQQLDRIKRLRIKFT